MDSKFWSVAELQIVDNIEIEHYIAEAKGTIKSIEAYDIKLRDGFQLVAELDITPEMAEELYEKLKEALGK